MIIIDSLKAKLAAIKAAIASKLTDKAKWWHRLWSIRLMIVTSFYSAAAGAWRTGMIPDEWKPQLSHWEQAILAGIGVVLPGIAAVSVVVKQTKLAEDMAVANMPECRVPEPLAPEVPHGDGQA